MTTPNRVARATHKALPFAFLAVLLATLPATAFAADLGKGKTLYLAHCSGCHGENGFSTMPQAPNFARGESLAQPDPVLMDAIRAGSDLRPPFLGILNDREILDVISYVRTLL